MKKVIESIKQIHIKKPVVYQGKGEFRELTVNLNKGISTKEITKKLDPENIILPQDYVTLLNFSNGISFYDTFDCKIFGLEDVIDLMKYDEEWLEEKYVHIARFYEDAIYLKCDGSERNVYVSEEGMTPLRPLNMSFKAFVDASLISGFSYFWLWGTEDYDLY